MVFTCIRCDGREFDTLRGWKMHMTKTHGGYDADDLTAAVQAAGGEVTEDNVASRMQAFARTVGGEQGEDVASGNAEKAAPEASGAPPPVPSVKTIKATPRKLKKILGAIPTKLLEGAGIDLDDEDKEAMDESGEFLTDIFGFEFEVPAEKRIVRSRLLAITWVFGVAALIYIKHHFSDVWKKLADDYKKRQTGEPENVQ